MLKDPEEVINRMFQLERLLPAASSLLAAAIKANLWIASHNLNLPEYKGGFEVHNFLDESILVMTKALEE